MYSRILLSSWRSFRCTVPDEQSCLWHSPCLKTWFAVAEALSSDRWCLAVLFSTPLFFALRVSTACQSHRWSGKKEVVLSCRWRILLLKRIYVNALDWFESNILVANPSEFQMMLLGTKLNNKICMEINGATVCPSASVKFLGTTIDDGLKFYQHVRTLFQKVSKNVKAFTKVASLLDLNKAKLLHNSFLLSNFNSFLLSNFNYCPLIWIFCGKRCNREMNLVHYAHYLVTMNLVLKTSSPRTMKYLSTRKTCKN